MQTHIQITNLPEIITLKEAISFLQITRPTIAKLRREGQLPACRLGNKLYFTRTDVERFINRNRDEIAYTA